MKINVFLSMTAAMFLISCESENQNTAADTQPVNTVVKTVSTEGPAKNVATLSIEGMGCEMACGSAIKKALSGLDGVIATEIHFDADNETDFAVVEFDDTKVSGDQMVAAVSELRKGLYSVTEVNIEKHVSSAAGGEKVEGEGKRNEQQTKNQPQMELRSFNFPNVLDVLNRFIR